MVRKIAVLISLISITCVNAQWAEHNAIYLTAEISLGNYAGADISLNYVNKDNYTFKAGYSGNSRTPRSQPDDFTAGLDGMLFLGTTDPYDELENYHIGFGKIYKLNESGTIRANIAAGLGITTISEPQNWERNDDNFFGANYTWDIHKYNTISLIINPKIEFPFTRFFGVTASPMLQVNKDRTYIGIGIGPMIGLLRKGRTTSGNDDN